MKKLEDIGLIIRETHNIKGGKERHLKINKAQFDTWQGSNWPLHKGQNDTIKDNNKKR
jgi:hypothetical protein